MSRLAQPTAAVWYASAVTEADKETHLDNHEMQ